MPVYVYGCGADGNFEAAGSHNDSCQPCPVCHQPARRRPFSGLPNLKGDTVARTIPDPSYRQEAEKRHLNQIWGDASRAAEMLRKNVVEDAQGNKQIDMKGMNT